MNWTFAITVLTSAPTSLQPPMSSNVLQSCVPVFLGLVHMTILKESVIHSHKLHLSLTAFLAHDQYDTAT